MEGKEQCDETRLWTQGEGSRMSLLMDGGARKSVDRCKRIELWVEEL